MVIEVEVVMTMAIININDYKQDYIHNLKMGIEIPLEILTITVI
jgi:hypothetical protein